MSPGPGSARQVHCRAGSDPAPAAESQSAPRWIVERPGRGTQGRRSLLRGRERTPHHPPGRDGRATLPRHDGGPIALAGSVDRRRGVPTRHVPGDESLVGHWFLAAGFAGSSRRGPGSRRLTASRPGRPTSLFPQCRCGRAPLVPVRSKPLGTTVPRPRSRCRGFAVRGGPLRGHPGSVRPVVARPAAHRCTLCRQRRATVGATGQPPRGLPRCARPAAANRGRLQPGCGAGGGKTFRRHLRHSLAYSRRLGGHRFDAALAVALTCEPGPRHGDG